MLKVSGCSYTEAKTSGVTEVLSKAVQLEFRFLDE
jgi:hypothetical protein